MVMPYHLDFALIWVVVIRDNRRYCEDTRTRTCRVN